jgi:hypothetical protein
MKARLWTVRGPARRVGRPGAGFSIAPAALRTFFLATRFVRVKSRRATGVRMMSAERHIGRARIYLSFADEDRARAMELVRWLNDGGWQVAADDRHIFPADNWSPPGRLDACDVIVCVITPAWPVSSHCRREYAYCAKRGKFILPVVCESFDLNSLPPAIRALPRVDLAPRRMTDYLALKEALEQAGRTVGQAAALAADARRHDAAAWTLRGLRIVGALQAAAARARQTVSRLLARRV